MANSSSRGDHSAAVATPWSTPTDRAFLRQSGARFLTLSVDGDTCAICFLNDGHRSTYDLTSTVEVVNVHTKLLPMTDLTVVSGGSHTTAALTRLNAAWSTHGLSPHPWTPPVMDLLSVTPWLATDPPHIAQPTGATAALNALGAPVDPQDSRDVRDAHLFRALIKQRAQYVMKPW